MTSFILVCSTLAKAALTKKPTLYHGTSLGAVTKEQLHLKCFVPRVVEDVFLSDAANQLPATHDRSHAENEAKLSASRTRTPAIVIEIESEQPLGSSGFLDAKTAPIYMKKINYLS